MRELKNEKGVTLIELLAVLVILSIILLLTATVLITSMKTTTRASGDQRLQQEANLIVETIRNEYLSKEGLKKIEINITENGLEMIDKVISTGYEYQFCENEANKQEIYKTTENDFCLEIKNSNGRHYTIETKFSKLY